MTYDELLKSIKEHCGTSGTVFFQNEWAAEYAPDINDDDDFKIIKRIVDIASSRR